MFADAPHVFDHTLLVIADRQPVDVVPCCRSRPYANILKAIGLKHGRFQALGKQVADGFIAEKFHAAIAVVNHIPFLGTEQLTGNYKRADGIVAGPAAGIADDMGVTFLQAGIAGWIEAGVHTSENGDLARRW